jgi:flagellar biosynthesis/type III secretory pathway protein FliH
MVVEATLRSSTNLIKRAETAESVSDWNPDVFQAHSSFEAETFEMLSEGVTDKTEWLGVQHHHERPAHTAWDVPQVDHLHSRVELTPQIPVGNKTSAGMDALSALISNKSGTPKRALIKVNQRKIDPFDWPTMEELFPQKVEEVPVVVVKEEQKVEEQIVMPDPEEVQRQIDEMLQETRLQAEEEAQLLSQQIMAQAQLEEEKILQQAREEASLLLMKANQQESEVLQRAYQRGMDAAKDEALSILSTAHAMINGTQEWHDKMLTKAETEVVGVLKEVAKNLFGQGYVLPEGALKGVLDQAITDAKPLGDIRIRLHPDDIAILGPLWVEQKSSLSGIKVDILPSENILRGGCAIEGEFGSLDAQVDIKLNRILEKIDEIQKIPVDLKEGEKVESQERFEERVILQGTGFIDNSGANDGDGNETAPAQEDGFFAETHLSDAQEDSIQSNFENVPTTFGEGEIQL